MGSDANNPTVPERRQRRSRQDSEEPIEDLFDFEADQVDYMSAESFPASDPPAPPSTIAPHDVTP
jgi:hypothetical protein